MNDRMRSRVLIAGAVLVVIGAGVVVGLRLGGGAAGSPRETVWGEPRSAIEFEASPGQSPEFVAAMRRVRNELPYKPEWDEEDVEFLVGEMDLDVSDLSRHIEAGAGAPALEESHAQDMEEREIRKTFSILVSAEVLGTSQPMSQDSRRRLEAMLMGLLEHQDPYYRRLGVDAMFDSGLIERDAVYHWVNEIAASDPDELTRERAAYLLNEYDLAVLGAGRDERGEGS